MFNGYSCINNSGNLCGTPGQLDPAVNDRFLSYLTRFIGAVLRPFFVVPYTVSNCRKEPENRVSDRLRSFTIRRNTAVILRL